MPTITVGTGKTYTTPQIAWDTLHASDQGSDVIVDCDAEDYPILNVTTNSVNKWTFRTVSQQYDGTGTTEDLLARFNRTIIGSAVSNFLTIEDISIYSSSSFQTPFTCGANNNQFNRLIIQQTATNNPTVSNSDAISSTNYANCVILGGADVVRSGFANGATKTNCLIAGGNDKGVEASGGVGVNIVINCFSFNNGGADYDTGQMTITTSASEDLTGTSTGFTSAECVDFGNRDYRIKNTSTLPANIGAFFEPGGGGVTVTGATANYNYTGIAGTVDLTGEVIVTGQTANYNYTAIVASIELGTEIIVTGQTANYNYAGINGSVELTGLITVIGQTANYDYSGIAADITLQGSIIVTGSTANYDYNALNATIILQGAITINPKNIIRVKRKSNTIRVKRKSNTIIVR